jgi:DNA invertase Pin-like site-specific DNA recombinase
MVFTVLGAVAELERSLIVERVKAGLRNARAKGKRLGRPKRVVDAHRIAELRSQGRLEENFARDGDWRRDALSVCRRGFQNSGKGFLNPYLTTYTGPLLER